MPDWRNELRARLSSLRLSPAREAEIIQELEQHLDDRYAEYTAAGESPAAAYAKALETELRGSEAFFAQLRNTEPTERNQPGMFANLGQDVRYALRILRQNPVFTVIAIVTIAIGIGANSAIFTVVRNVVLKPLPYPDSERLVRIREVTPQLDSFAVSQPNFLDWDQQNGTFASMGAYGAAAFNLASDDGAERVSGLAISRGILPTFGVTPAMGRNFLPEEDRPGGNTRVVIVSHAFWRDHLGSDPNALGKSITLSENPYTIVGVMPQTFSLNGNDADVFVPLAPGAGANRDDHRLNVMGRLKPGVTIEQARSDMKLVAQQLSDRFPDSNKGWGVYIPTLYETIVTDDMRRSLNVLSAAAIFVLLITCGNVANLLLARATARQREISIRLALGSGRFRMIRQLVIESLAMSIIGGAFGMALAYAGTNALKKLDANVLPRMNEIQMDGTVLLFTFGLSVITGVLFGLAPAIQSAGTNLQESLKDGSRGSGGVRRQRLRSSLVVLEMALSVALLAGAGVLLRSFWTLQHVQPGFDPSHVLTMRINLPASRYGRREQARAFYEQLQPRLRAIPGVQSVAIASNVPMGGGNTGMAVVPPDATAKERPFVDWRIVSPDYFRTLEIPIRGREFGAEDKPAAPPTVIISQEMARRFWPGEDPIGKTFRWDGDNADNTIVGVAGNVQNTALDSPPRSVVYMPLAPNANWNPMIVSIRVSQEPAAVMSDVRRVVRHLDSNVPVFAVQTADELVRLSLGDRRFRTFLLGSFAVTALVLSCLGLFSVMAYAVSQRTHEIGIRISLGAKPRDVFGLVVGRGMLLAAGGTVIGLGGGFFLSRWLKQLLFRVQPTDPIAFLGAVFVLLSVSFLACYMPARRATRVDPLVALRHE
jgi:putative ABC transport system permease protein